MRICELFGRCFALLALCATLAAIAPVVAAPPAELASRLPADPPPAPVGVGAPPPDQPLLLLDHVEFYPLSLLSGSDNGGELPVRARFDEADAGDPGFDLTDPPVPESAIVPIDPLDVPVPSRRGGVWSRLSHGFSDWTSRLSLGSRVLAGNSNQNFVDFAADFERTEDDRRFTQINLLGQFGESDGTVVANRWFANSTTDYYRGDQWLVFLKVMDQYDQLQNLDYRGTLSGGAGYRFFFEDHKRLVVRVGPGVTGEVFHNPSDKRLTPDLFGEVEVRLPLWERLKWEQKTTVFPSLSSLDVARATNQTSFLYAFDEKEQWSLKFGMLYQYISQPNTGRLPNDLTTNFSIVYLRK
ncbi:MAG: DUF481 domain-containing protein [Planctomycetaceae bacterium]